MAKEAIIPFPFPLKGVVTGNARQEQPRLTTPSALNVWPAGPDHRARGSVRPGIRRLLASGFSADLPLFRQATRCRDGKLVNLWVPESVIESYPYNFQWLDWDGECYVVPENAARSTNPGRVPRFRILRSGCNDPACASPTTDPTPATPSPDPDPTPLDPMEDDPCHALAASGYYRGRRAMACPDQLTLDWPQEWPIPSENLWVVDAEAVTSATAYFRWGGFAYEVDLTQAEQDLPIEAEQVLLRASCASCEDALTGVPVSYCGNQDIDLTGLPRLFVRHPVVEAGTIYFQYRGVACMLDPTTPPMRIDWEPGSEPVFLRPTAQFASCEEATAGALATPCSGQGDELPPVWIHQTAMPAEGASIFSLNLFGVPLGCYSIAADATRVPRPATAYPWWARQSRYDTCQDCLDGVTPNEILGVKALPCLGQSDEALYPEVWVAAADLPSARITFYWNLCFSLDPTTTPEPIPAGAMILQPVNEYADCAECVSQRINIDPFPPGPDPNLPDPPPPPTPPNINPPEGPQADDKQGKFLQLEDCPTKQPAQLWVPARLGSGKSVLVGGDCYKVLGVESTGKAAASVSQVYAGCDQCEDIKKVARLYLCSTGQMTNPAKYIKWQVFIDGGGYAKPVIEVGGVKYYVPSGAGRGWAPQGADVVTDPSQITARYPLWYCVCPNTITISVSGFDDSKQPGVNLKINGSHVLARQGASDLYLKYIKDASDFLPSSIYLKGLSQGAVPWTVEIYGPGSCYPCYGGMTGVFRKASNTPCPPPGVYAYITTGGGGISNACGGGNVTPDSRFQNCIVRVEDYG